MLKKMIEEAIRDLLTGDAGKDAPSFEPFKPGQKVIVRSRDAGCLYGTLECMDAKAFAVTLTDARQMWSWKATKGITILDCAEFGVDSAKCKFSPAKRRVTVLNACAVVEVSAAAIASLEAATNG